MKILFLADFFLDDLIGGGEICNECVFLHLNKKHNITKVKTSIFSLELAKQNKDSLFIIGNFCFLKKEVVDYITNNCKYIIYEHDYKFHTHRNPAKYVNFLVPEQQIIYKDFYKSASKIICQTAFQAKIFVDNLKLNNILSIGTNFWLEEHYTVLEQMANTNKNGLCAIIEYNIDHKNTLGAVNYCKQNNIPYQLIKDSNYINFLKKLGRYSKFVFLPQTPETFSRTTAEAKMMNMTVLTNNLIGCKKEEWFDLFSGIELIKFTKEKNTSAYNTFENLLCNL